MQTRVDAALQAALERSGLQGVVAMAANRDGVIHATALGERDSGQRMALDSVARIASMTKAITSVAALRQVERGTLTLDGPISDVIPELAHPMILDGFGEDGSPILRPAQTPITLRHLLTHTAGFGYDTWSALLARLNAQRGVARIPTTAEELRQTPLLFEPGTRWNYGINTDLVGYAAERASGKRLNQLIHDDITAPLGMQDTAFLTTPAQESRRIAVQRRAADGSLSRTELPLPTTLPLLFGGGGLHSTALDYMKFLQAILGGALLGPEMQAELTRPQTGDVNVVPMTAAIPSMSNNVSLYPGMDLKWSLGFLVNSQDTEEGRSAGSLAWAGLFNSYYWIDPRRGTCGVLITQLLPFADKKVLEMFAAYEAAINAAL